ncbi:hypothetical protein CC78DRAFT_327464 [Lojkania enalia]|uniref:Uncharacterized protein n=1 Tax=Lojkania enalia TaxID=147567 RepID=A0A9P4N189_9PLEO|nr:hypothetical protein CC78DRAFT_327464 [Didymosphaeria enalia]
MACNVRSAPDLPLAIGLRPYARFMSGDVTNAYMRGAVGERTVNVGTWCSKMINSTVCEADTGSHGRAAETSEQLTGADYGPHWRAFERMEPLGAVVGWWWRRALWISGGQEASRYVSPPNNPPSQPLIRFRQQPCLLLTEYHPSVPDSPLLLFL